jgi:hypothetical protein
MINMVDFLIRRLLKLLTLSLDIHSLTLLIFYLHSLMYSLSFLSCDLFLLFSPPPDLTLPSSLPFVLSINDKHTRSCKKCQQYPPLSLMATLNGCTRLLGPPTVASTPLLFSPFDINVKENMIPLSCCSTFQRYQIFNQHILPLIGWTCLGESRDDTQLLTKIFKTCLG